MSSAVSETPTYPRIKELDVNATEAEIKQLLTIIDEAFKDDPYGFVLLGGDFSLARAEFDAHIRATLIGGTVHALTLGPAAEDIVGVALWYPPGKTFFSSAEERAAGWDQFFASLPESLRIWRTEYFGPAMAKMSEDSLIPGYSLNAWYLHIFGVQPGHQGKGYGRALFDFAERQAKATHSNMVVKTSDEVDVKIYTRLGFRICGETDLKSDFGNPHVYLMVKDYQCK